MDSKTPQFYIRFHQSVVCLGPLHFCLVKWDFIQNKTSVDNATLAQRLVCKYEMRPEKHVLTKNTLLSQKLCIYELLVALVRFLRTTTGFWLLKIALVRLRAAWKTEREHSLPIEH